MNVDELINKLQHFRAVYGDLPVLVGYDGCAYSSLVDVLYDEEHNWYKKPAIVLWNDS